MNATLEKLIQGDLAGITCLHQDNRTLPQALLEKVDAIVTDPPYGMAWDGDSTRFSGKKLDHTRGEGRTWAPIMGDARPFDPTPWLGYRHVVLWGANHYAQRLPVGTTLVWIKRMPHLFGTFLSDAELGWHKGGHGVYCWEKPFDPVTRAKDAGLKQVRGIHPTQKPVSLMIWAMEQAGIPKDALVLDPYAGSGTTGIACHRTGRRCVMVEQDPDFFQTMKERVERETAQLTFQDQTRP